MNKLTIILVLLSLQGCAAYTVVSGTSYITTGKGITDHVSSTLAQADCNAVHVVKTSYYCEVARTPDSTYNRSAF